MVAISRYEAPAFQPETHVFHDAARKRLWDRYRQQFRQGVILNANFEHDRFLMEACNQAGDLSRFLHLLRSEIEELFEQRPVGYWHDIDGDLVKKKEYLRQEIADVVIFCFTGFIRLGQEIDQDKIFDEAYQGRRTEAAPQRILESMVSINKQLALDSSLLTNATPEIIEIMKAQLKDYLETLIILCTRLSELIGFNLWTAVCEKCARNVIKYPAVLMKKPEVLENSQISGLGWSKLYREASVASKTLFKQALNPTNYVRHPASIVADFSETAHHNEKEWKATWGDADKGTQEFYSIARDPEETLSANLDFAVINQALLAVNMIQ